jgi:hypothetical protein
VGEERGPLTSIVRDRESEENWTMRVNESVAAVVKE